MIHYINVLSNNAVINKFCIIKIDSGNFTSIDFADELHNKFKLFINDIPAAEGGQFFTTTYNYKKYYILLLRT